MTSRNHKKSRSWLDIFDAWYLRKPCETDGCFKLTTYRVEQKQWNIHALRRYLLNTDFVFVDHWSGATKTKQLIFFAILLILKLMLNILCDVIHDLFVKHVYDWRQSLIFAWLRVDKGWGVQKMMSKFPGRNWKLKFFEQINKENRWKRQSWQKGWQRSTVDGLNSWQRCHCWRNDLQPRG